MTDTESIPDWGGSSVEPKWVEIQKKTFTRWANTFLKERMLKLDDMETGFSDGVLLINLLEIISSKSVGKYNKNPKLRTHKLENNLFALEFLKKEGIKLVNIGNQDVVDCKLKLILGLIWTIILRYQINIAEGKSARSDLLKWVQKQIPEYNIQGFTKDWNDGRAICALANSLMPGICTNHRELDPNNALQNAILGTDLAEKELEIPKVLDPYDMINPDVDELSVMTYISYFRDWEQNRAKKLDQERLEKIAVPERCRAYGPGLERAETNIPTEFTIEAINQFMRRVPIGGDPFVVTINGPSSTVEPKLTDNNDGTYKVDYTPTEPGIHNIKILLHDKNISNSPFRVPVAKSVADPTKTKMYGPGLEGGFVLEPAEFTIEAYNRVGDPLPTGGDPFKVQVKGPFNSDIPANIVDNKNGKYSVTYQPIDAGDHIVSVTLTDKPVAQSPVTVKIEKSTSLPDYTTTIAYGPGLEGGSTSEPAQFTVEVRNSKGEKINKPGAPIYVDVESPSGNEIEVKQVDNEDGTFTVTYEPKEPGTCTVNVMLGHPAKPFYYDHINNSPFKVPIEAGTDAANSIAYGPGLENNVQDTLPTSFTIQAKDRDGNNMKKGGDPFEVSISGPDGPVDSNLTDNGDGTYTVAYAPNTAGKHKVDVKLKDKNIKDAPFTVNVKAGADFHKSQIEGFSFTVQAKTKKGELKKDGGDNFTVSITDSDGNPVPDVKVQDLNNGVYTCSYKLEKQGEYSISVKLNDQDIQGSPFKQNI